MKNIKFLFLAVATLLAGAFTACQKDWNPGPMDAENSVYLPVEVNVAAFPTTDDPETTDVDERLRALYPVYRQGTTGELTVEIRSRMMEADLSFIIARDEQGNPTETLPFTEAFIFDESVTFADGENVAYFGVTLNNKMVSEEGKPRLAVGEMYEAEIMIKDSQYHGNYGLHRKSIQIGIPESWGSANVNYDPTSEEKFTNEGYLYDDYISGLYQSTPGNVAPVVIEQSESRPGVYRLVNPFNEENVVTFIGGVPSDMTFTDVNIEIDATDPEKIWVDYQFVGMTVDGLGDLYIGIPGGAEFGKLENGVITFPANGLGLFLADGRGMYANTSGKMKIVLPGISIADYNLDVAYVGSEAASDNSGTNAIVSFNVGADVSRFGFVAVTGKQEIKTMGIGGVKYNPGIVDLQNYIKYVDEGGDPEEYDYSVCAEGTIGENMSLAKPNEDTWYMSFDKADVYTIFAIPYDKDGNALMDNIATTYFYYRPTNSEEAVPALEEYAITMGAPSEIVGPVHSGYGVQMDLLFHPSFTLACDINYEDIDYVSTIKGYFAKKADVDAKRAEGETDESLIASEDADDLTDWIADIKAGQGIMTLQGLEPGTEYSMIIAATSIYGKTTYSYAEAKTAPYAGAAKIGIYEFADGDSKMQIKFAPYFLSSYAVNYYSEGITDDCDGQVYFLSWVGDTLKPAEDAEDQTPIELKFYGLYMPEFKAIVCHSQAYGYEGYSLFGVGLDTYIDGTEKEGDPEKYWGYYSSSTSDYEYATEALVVYLDEEGAVSKLGTYFKKYYYWTEEVATGEKDKDGKDITEEKYFEETLASFAPATTTITLVEDHMPVITPEEDDNTGTEGGDDNTGTEGGEENTENTPEQSVKRASVKVYNGSLKAQLKANVDFNAAAATATVCIK